MGGKRRTQGAADGPGRAVRDAARAAAARRSAEIVAEAEERRRVAGHGPPYGAIAARGWRRWLEAQGRRWGR